MFGVRVETRREGNNWTIRSIPETSRKVFYGGLFIFGAISTLIAPWILANSNYVERVWAFWLLRVCILVSAACTILHGIKCCCVLRIEMRTDGEAFRLHTCTGSREHLVLDIENLIWIADPFGLRQSVSLVLELTSGSKVLLFRQTSYETPIEKLSKEHESVAMSVAKILGTELQYKKYGSPGKIARRS